MVIRGCRHLAYCYDLMKVLDFMKVVAFKLCSVVGPSFARVSASSILSILQRDPLQNDCVSSAKGHKAVDRVVHFFVADSVACLQDLLASVKNTKLSEESGL
ncbi:hypothetical protein DPMN_043214 [Dreissena polymorpha]|uniref:Uncharacterized protein n=1 Tax=Dreissena polymorpha TaxID=45954 RepID=A0A9D4HXQ6_DREPO|nr:hypothetical protein DPMN_043214 [Dreissena polymorpha]